MSTPNGVHSFGTELRWCQLDGIRISETLMPRGLRLGDHFHEAGQICFILEGEYRDRASDGDHRLYPGALQFHAPGESHSNVFSSESDVLTLLISIDSDRWLHVGAQRPVTADAILRNCTDEIRRELGRMDDASRATLAAGFRQFKNTSVGEYIRDRRVRCVMRELVNSKAPLCEIATKCGFHDQAHMGLVFRKAVGVSPGVYRSVCK